MTYTNPVLGFLILLALLGAIRGWKFGKALTITALVGLFLWSWPPIAWLLSGSLEWWFPPAGFSSRDAQAIVVLSGGMQPPDPTQPETLPSLDTYLRCSHAAWVYQHSPARPVVATGGPDQHNRVVAQVMRATLQKLGVPDSMIWTEGQSHSTYQNALFTARLLRQKNIHKIVLVTEAYHMLRAVDSFRHQGLEVIPAPCCYRTAGLEHSIQELLPSAHAIHNNDEVLHEWIGVLWYRISGKA